MLDDDDLDEIYSITSSKAVYKRRSRSTRESELSRSRSHSHPTRESEGTLLTITTSSERPRRDPLPEAKQKYWKKINKYEIDYNNQNYVRSKCNKNQGLHRKIAGRPYKYNVQYDNNYFLKSQVNAPLGNHRAVHIRGKLVPEEDFLDDSTGWEFDYGPEFFQVEEDIPYIPEGKIVARGCFRFYGVKRNKSDVGEDDDLDEYETALSDDLKERMKYGREFCQIDRPHIRDIKDYRISRGGYFHYDVDRNYYDLYPDDLELVEYDLERERQKLKIADDNQKFRKGKNFRRTILNKVHELGKPQKPVEKVIRLTKLSFIPGEGEQTFYEGVPATKTVYKTKRSSLDRCYSSEKRNERNLENHEIWEMETKSVRSREEESEREHRPMMRHERTKTRKHQESRSERDYITGEADVFKKMPPHIQERVNNIRSKMTKQLEEAGKMQHSDFDSEIMLAQEEADKFMKPVESEIKGFEKYVEENGSEVWIKTEEKMSRHRNQK